MYNRPYMSTYPILIAIALLCALGAFIIALANNLRLKKLLRGKKADSLEEIIRSLDADIKGLQRKHSSSEMLISELQTKMQGALRYSGFVKFNALPDLGGNQSFALALLNEQKCGYLITFLSVRDRLQLFTKQVKNGIADFDLSEEEETALHTALKST